MENIDIVKDSNVLIQQYLLPLGWKAGGALIIWLVGGLFIKGIAKVSREGMNRNRVDATLINYTISAIQIALRVLLVLAILSVFGVETTSFAAFIAAAGIAIGAAWAGLLSNLAAGVFIIILRPYKVGDYISGGGIGGTVTEISIFTTTLETFDLVKVFVGNSKIFADNIHNFTMNEVRRVDLNTIISSSVPFDQAVNIILAEAQKMPELLKTPAPDFAIEKFTDAGYLLNVRLFCRAQDYWTIHAGGNKAILTALQSSGFPSAAPTRFIIQK